MLQRKENGKINEKIEGKKIYRSSSLVAFKAENFKSLEKLINVRCIF